MSIFVGHGKSAGWHICRDWLVLYLIMRFWAKIHREISWNVKPKPDAVTRRCNYQGGVSFVSNHIPLDYRALINSKQFLRGRSTVIRTKQLCEHGTNLTMLRTRCNARVTRNSKCSTMETNWNSLQCTGRHWTTWWCHHDDVTMITTPLQFRKLSFYLYLKVKPLITTASLPSNCQHIFSHLSFPKNAYWPFLTRPPCATPVTTARSHLHFNWPRTAETWGTIFLRPRWPIDLKLLQVCQFM